MSYLDMKSELAQSIPGMSRIYAGTLINRAWEIVRESNLWSFQLGQGGFATPEITTTGSITASIGSTSIVGDAAASAAWAALPLYFAPTVQQFRATGYSIYNIIAFDGVSTLTLDRPFIDPIPQLSGVGYEMFLAYIPAPQYFKRWLTIADLFNCYALEIWEARRTIDLVDPARLYTSDPIYFMPLGTDQRPGSATLGQMLYELYPTPASAISYQTYYVISGAPLVNNTDIVPYPITEELILYKARQFAYEWAEARKDVMAAKGSGANYLTLTEYAKKEFNERLKTIRLIDRDQVDSYKVRMQAAISSYRYPYYNSITGRANLGLMF